MNYLKSFLLTSGIVLGFVVVVFAISWVVTLNPAYVFVALPVGMFLIFWGLLHDIMKDMGK
jgi:cytochrome c biogenesis protein CcdA